MPRWTTCALVVALGATLVGCASNAETGFPDPSEVPERVEHGACADATDDPTALDGEIYVLDNCYLPRVATVSAGASVTWLQDGVAPHSVTFSELDINSHPGCSDAASCMADGDEFTATLSEAGEFIYYCIIHGSADGTGMAATIIVE